MNYRDFPDSQDQSYRATYIRTLLLCFLTATVEGFDVQSSGVAGPGMAAELGLDPHQMGLVFAASSFGLAVGAVLGGRLADFIGRKRVLVTSLILFGALSLATSFAPDYFSLILVRVLTGLGLGGAMPNIIALAAEATEARGRTTTVALVFAGLPLGGTAASLVSYLGASPGNWRSIFYVGGIAPLVIAPVIVVWIPESRRFLAVRAAQLAEHASRPRLVAALFHPGRQWTTLYLWTSSFVTLVVLFLMLNWLPSLMIARGLDKQAAALVQIVFSIGGTLGSIVLGWMMQGESRSKVIVLAYIGVAAFLTALATFQTVVGAPLLFAALAGGFFLIGSQIVLYGLAPLYYPTSCRATGSGASLAMGRLGGIVGPILGGQLLVSGKDVSAILIATLPLVLVGGIAAWALMFKPRIED